MEQVNGAPVQQHNDIVAGREFLSVFINGAMAPVPVAPPSPRRRGYRKGAFGGSLHSTADNVPAESRQSEASIYRISRAPSSPRPMVTRSGHREESARLYPINQKTMESRDSITSISGELTNSSELGPNVKQGQQAHQASPRFHQNKKTSTILHRIERIFKSNETENSGSLDSGTIGKSRTMNKNFNQKVIGVSVTSTVEATPYKVRVEHHEVENKFNVVTRPPMFETITTEASTMSPITSSFATTLMTTTTTTSTTSRPTTTTSTTSVTPLPAHLVTEELSNIVSESNRSEFSVDEGLPKTSWRNRTPVTTGSIVARASTPFSSSSSSSSSSTSSFSRRHHKDEIRDSQQTSTSLEPVEESYEVPEENSEAIEMHKEMPEHVNQGRKAGRHYDANLYNQPPKVYPHHTLNEYGKVSRVYSEATKNNYPRPKVNYGEPARVYSEPAKIYSEPAKIYSEPSKIYGEPAKVYGEPERVYGEPAKIYSEPARVYGEPAKVYSEPAKIYGEPSKIYGSDGRPVTHRRHEEEPEEQNYEVDEAVSVGSNGNVHGPQVVTEAAPRASSSPSLAGSQDSADGHKVGYVVEDRNYRKYRVEERTPDGFIVGEYGVVSHDDGSLRGVRYTADGTIDPRLIYDALMKFLAL